MFLEYPNLTVMRALITFLMIKAYVKFVLHSRIPHQYLLRTYFSAFTGLIRPAPNLNG